MLQFLKWGGLTIVAVLILCWLFIWFVASGVNETITYTEKDFFKYHTLTNKDIAQAPRITDEYYFESHPGDGYEPTNSITFKGATGIAPLKVYLKEMGYIRDRRSLGEMEIWLKPGQSSGNQFYLYFNAATGDAELTKVLNN
ncbi:hypothetical protein [Trabulsiella odontotermitis]|uniref:hypothetical protein n=1 Tax=Trabulsiella odontotermitis TaxID=379893 RepID=UPI000675CD6C|nr:hypothetical protein [Trabulsiella odontotermitis]KNC89519.1 hypothetical protein GM30_07830 [Trabulsiella odontotermitis]